MDEIKMIDDKKFMWDGENYESETAAQENISKYSEDGFDIRQIEEDGKFLIYTRRVVLDVVVEGEPP